MLFLADAPDISPQQDLHRDRDDHDDESGRAVIRRFGMDDLFHRLPGKECLFLDSIVLLIVQVSTSCRLFFSVMSLMSSRGAENEQCTPIYTQSRQMN